MIVWGANIVEMSTTIINTCYIHGLSVEQFMEYYLRGPFLKLGLRPIKC